MLALYVAVDVLGISLLVPLSLASFASSLVQSLGTPWGLFRHWWVIAKLAISVVATPDPVLYTSSLRLLGAAAASPSLADIRTCSRAPRRSCTPLAPSSFSWSGSPVGLQAQGAGPGTAGASSSAAPPPARVGAPA